LFSIPKITMNVFGMLDWLTKKWWPQILKHQLKGAAKEANNSSVTNEPLERELFKLFS
jgi:hypothetical protein